MLSFSPNSIWYNADRVAVIVQFSCPVHVMSGLDYNRYRIGITQRYTVKKEMHGDFFLNTEGTEKNTEVHGGFF